LEKRTRKTAKLSLSLISKILLRSIAQNSLFCGSKVLEENKKL